MKLQLFHEVCSKLTRSKIQILTSKSITPKGPTLQQIKTKCNSIHLLHSSGSMLAANLDLNASNLRSTSLEYSIFRMSVLLGS